MIDKMHNKIEQNPTITLHSDIQSLCSPLNQLGITYFCHVNVNKNLFAALSNNPEFHRFYLKNNYQNADIHLASTNAKTQFYIWDHIEVAGKSAELDNESLRFGINHTFTLHRQDERGDHFYHFATSHRDKSFNQVYINNLDLLNLFINKFNITTYNSSALSEAYSQQFVIDENHSEFNLSKNSEQLDNRQQFLSEIWENNKFPLKNGATLSLRQLQILYWLNNGKTINDISRIVNLAEITVHKHITLLKEQLNCYTQFQLGVCYAELFSGNQDLKTLIQNHI